jgi:hypothetical protein
MVHRRRACALATSPDRFVRRCLRCDPPSRGVDLKLGALRLEGSGVVSLLRLRARALDFRFTLACYFFGYLTCKRADNNLLAFQPGVEEFMSATADERVSYIVQFVESLRAWPGSITLAAG